VSGSGSVAQIRTGRHLGIEARFGEVVVRQPRPVRVVIGSASQLGRASGYDEAEAQAGRFTGRARVRLTTTAWLNVVDEWRVVEGELRVHRRLAVAGNSGGSFATALTIAREGQYDVRDVRPFIPGVSYGDCEPVRPRSIGSRDQRERGLRWLLVREDRMAVPMVVLWYGDGTWIGVQHLDPTADTIAADGDARLGGERLVDERIGVVALGVAVDAEGLQLGAWLPGSEGEITYSSGPLPLRRLRAWRRRAWPIRDGLVRDLEVVFRVGEGSRWSDVVSGNWRRAYAAVAPRVVPCDVESVLRDATEVLAGQVVGAAGHRYGVPLTVDSRSGQVGSTAAVMGFVGANTDVGEVLVRMSARAGGAQGDRYQRLGHAIIDSFVRLPVDPPRAEGFDLVTGRQTTYRRVRGRRAVYLRSLAEGCHAVLRAWGRCQAQGHDHVEWLDWARRAGDWLVDVQRTDGSWPRAWATSGRVVEAAGNASQVAVPLLVELARVTQDERYLQAATRAGEHCWNTGGSEGCYAGATLDNPNVVDKEAAVIAMEAFLDLHDATGDRAWLERARSAGAMAETWIYIWNVPMPVDADAAQLDWKPGVSTIGQQLITTGASMADIFLAVNAAAFARLGMATGDEHWIEIARLVTHGTKAMMASTWQPFDLVGPGWEQEHWSFAPPRGMGLNRDWLPWVGVAAVRGLLRVMDLPDVVARQVIR
jgi:hypothetical protein